MRIDAQSPFVWRDINQKLKESLGCNSNVHIYRGLHQAIFETCLGLHLRFGHKRKIVAETGFGDHLSRTEMEMARVGVRFKKEFGQDMAKEQKECLAYIHDLDDALTAELYDHIDTLKAVSQTKMYRIHIAHHLFHIRKGFIKNLGEYDIIITSLTPEYCLVFTGEKVSLPMLTVAQLNWSIENDFANVAEILLQKNKLYQPEILAFEKSLPSGVEPWFPDMTIKRIYDRSVVILKDHDGSAMQDLLNQALGQDKTLPGWPTKVESASLCRWHNEAWFSQAEDLGRTKNDLRGLVAIDGQVINEGFKKVFSSCLEKLKQLSH